MKILWLTIDRSKRVADIFGPLQREVPKLDGIEVEFVVRDDWSRETIMGEDQNKPMLTHQTVNGCDVIFTDAVFAYMSEDWSHIDKPKALLVEDLHGPLVSKYMSAARFAFEFDMVFVRYWEAFKNHWAGYWSNRRTAWLPHCIDPAIFRDYGMTKSYSLLSVGRINNAYPLRQLIHEQLKDTMYYERIERPEEGNGTKWPVGPTYGRTINRAKIAFSCSSIYKYPLLKTFEIPGCRTALMCDWIPEMKQLGFVPFKNFIPINEYQSVKLQVETWLNQNIQLHEITDAGYELVHGKHTAKVRANEFVAHLQDLIDNHGIKTKHQPLAHA